VPDKEKKPNTSNTKQDLVGNLMSALAMHISQDRITSPKEDLEYEKLFRKTLEVKSNSSGKLMKKQSNILYQNLSEARRKINMLSKLHKNKSSLFA
jgi:5-bromo-4-chloroindolyl phosphate hydrolysis protein